MGCGCEATAAWASPSASRSGRGAETTGSAARLASSDEIVENRKHSSARIRAPRPLRGALVRGRTAAVVVQAADLSSSRNS